MSKTAINFWLNALSFLALLGLTATGGIIHYVLLPGTGHSHELFGLGRHEYGDVHFYLAVVAVILLVLHLIMHWSWICCVIAKALKRAPPPRRARTIWGMTTLLVCSLALGLGLCWASSLVKQRPDSSPQHREGGTGRGRSTWKNGSQERGLGIHDQTGAAVHGRDVGAPGYRGRGKSSRPGSLHKEEELCSAGTRINGRSTLLEAARAAELTSEDMLKALHVSGPVDPQGRLGRLKRHFGFSIHEVRQIICRTR